jgi:hypothetical protein
LYNAILAEGRHLRLNLAAVGGNWELGSASAQPFDVQRGVLLTSHRTAARRDCKNAPSIAWMGGSFSLKKWIRHMLGEAENGCVREHDRASLPCR